MFRFSDFLLQQTPDFWKIYFQNKDVIQFLDYVNAVLGASTGGYPLLGGYDIMDIANHLPGKTVVWEPITFGPLVMNDTSEFQYTYAIDTKWLQIVNLYDRYADPTISYQDQADYIIPQPGTIGFLKPPALMSMLVSKGQIVSTRLTDDIGTAFGYSRYDSFYYRDTFMPLLAIFMIGPTIPLLTAGFNIMLGNPVAKYGNETIRSTKHGQVWTDKYQYDLGGAELSYGPGDIVGATKGTYTSWPDIFPAQKDFQRFAPLADAVSLVTTNNTPKWWEGIAPQLFQKYADAVLTEDTKNILMDTFLKYYVSMVKLDFDKLDGSRIVYQSDIKDLIMDGVSLRSDFLFYGNYHFNDTIPYPDTLLERRLQISPHAYSMWSNYNNTVSTAMWLYPPNIVQPVVFADGSNALTYDWDVGSFRYRILYDYEKYFEFWSEHSTQNPYVEPAYDDYFFHQAVSATLQYGQRSNIDIITDNPAEAEKGAVLTMPYGPQSNMTPICAEVQFTDQTGIITVSNDTVTDLTVTNVWALSGSAVQTYNGITCGLLAPGTAISPALPTGNIPKKVTITIQDTIPAGTSLAMSYSVAGGPLMPLPSGGVIPSFAGSLILTAVLTASAVNVPTLRGVIVQLSPIVL